MLQVRVQGQFHRAAILRLDRRLLASRHDGTVGCDLKGLRARRTRQERVELSLHARGPLSLGVDGSDHWRCDVTVGVLALEHRLPFDPVDVELTDLTIGHSINVAFDVFVG